MLYLTSDLHIGHTRIVELAYRPFSSVEEMNETIIQRWRDTVSDDDTVLVLGDIVMGRRMETLPLLEQLTGLVLLVPGNHDYVHPMHGEKMVNRWVPEYSKYLDICLNLEGELSNLEGEFSWPPHEEYSYCHFPIEGDHTPEERYLEWRPKNKSVPHLHGHVHGHTPVFSRSPIQIDVGVDAWDYTPVSIDRIAELLAQEGLVNPHDEG